MKLLYVSRQLAGHDRRFLDLFAAHGLEAVGVTAADSLAQVAREVQPQLTVAGPVHDRGALAAHAGLRPLAVLSWGFDLLRDVSEEHAAREAAFALERADLAICDCIAAQQVALRLGARSTHVIPWGLDADTRALARHADDRRARLGWQDAIVVLCTRAWEPLYRIDTVLDAFAAAHAREPRLRSLLVGSGTLAGDIESRIRELGLTAVVHCPGRLDLRELMACHATADVYVSASEVDGTSVSLLEAMASGVPACASDVGGNREWIEPARCGRLFPVGDAPALAAAILEMAHLPRAERAALSQRSRDEVARRANWEANGAQLVAALRALA